MFLLKTQTDLCHFCLKIGKPGHIYVYIYLYNSWVSNLCVVEDHRVILATGDILPYNAKVSLRSLNSFLNASCVIILGLSNWRNPLTRDMVYTRKISKNREILPHPQKMLMVSSPYQLALAIPFINRSILSSLWNRAPGLFHIVLNLFLASAILFLEPRYRNQTGALKRATKYHVRIGFDVKWIQLKLNKTCRRHSMIWWNFFCKGQIIQSNQIEHLIFEVFSTPTFFGKFDLSFVSPSNWGAWKMNSLILNPIFVDVVMFPRITS